MSVFNVDLISGLGGRTPGLQTNKKVSSYLDLFHWVIYGKQRAEVVFDEMFY